MQRICRSITNRLQKYSLIIGPAQAAVHQNVGGWQAIALGQLPGDRVATLLKDYPDRPSPAFNHMDIRHACGSGGLVLNSSFEVVCV